MFFQLYNEKLKHYTRTLDHTAADGHLYRKETLEIHSLKHSTKLSFTGYILSRESTNYADSNS